VSIPNPGAAKPIRPRLQVVPFRALALLLQVADNIQHLAHGLIQTLSGKAAAKTEAPDELFAALDRAKDLRASERLSRDETHAR
jgi:hypothetical protein